MKTYIFILKNRKKKNCSETLFKSHLRHLKSLERKGLLMMCGPCDDKLHAVQILRAKSQRQALTFFKKDPYLKQRYFRDFDVFELSSCRWRTSPSKHLKLLSKDFVSNIDN